MGLSGVTRIEPFVQSLRDAANLFLAKAREELDEGLRANDWVRIRDAAEKAWNAAVQATDFAMQLRGRTPLPGALAHRDRRNFLESIGRSDLAEKYTFFAERLHGDVFYTGEAVPAATLRRYLDEVEDYIREVSGA